MFTRTRLFNDLFRRRVVRACVLIGAIVRPRWGSFKVQIRCRLGDGIGCWDRPRLTKAVGLTLAHRERLFWAIRLTTRSARKMGRL
jgi:hypothetical protein